MTLGNPAAGVGSCYLPPRSPAIITYLPRETHCLDVCTAIGVFSVSSFWHGAEVWRHLSLRGPVIPGGTIHRLDLGSSFARLSPSVSGSCRVDHFYGGLKTVALFIGLIIFGEWQQMLRHGWTLLCRAWVLDSRDKACLCCKIFNQHPRPEASGDRTQSDMAWGMSAWGGVYFIRIHIKEL